MSSHSRQQEELADNAIKRNGKKYVTWPHCESFASEYLVNGRGCGAATFEKRSLSLLILREITT